MEQPADHLPDSETESLPALPALASPPLGAVSAGTDKVSSEAQSEEESDPKKTAARRFRWRWVVLGVVLILLALAAAWWFNRSQIVPNTQTIQVQDLIETIDVSGAIISERDVMIKSEIPAAVRQRLVQLNQRVAAGTPLIQLSESQQSLQLKQTQVTGQGAIQQSQTELSTARSALKEIAAEADRGAINLRNGLQKSEENLFFVQRELTRSKRLYAEGVLSAQNLAQQQQQFEQARLDLKTAKNNLESAVANRPEVVNARNRVQQAQTALNNATKQAEANQALSRNALSQTLIRAPFTGSITQWEVNQGDYLSPGAPVGRLQDLDDLRLQVVVNELDFPRIALGAKAKLVFDAYPELSFEGSVVWKSEATVTGNENIQVFPLKIWFTNQAGKIKPGMSGDAEIVARTRKQVIAVPISAVDRKDDSYVVKLYQDGKTVEQIVTIGISTLDQVEILTGLKAGDQVILEAVEE